MVAAIADDSDILCLVRQQAFHFSVSEAGRHLVSWSWTYACWVICSQVHFLLLEWPVLLDQLWSTQRASSVNVCLSCQHLSSRLLSPCLGRGAGLSLIVSPGLWIPKELGTLWKFQGLDVISLEKPQRKRASSRLEGKTSWIFSSCGRCCRLMTGT